MLHADRWTDITQLVVSFRNFSKNHKNFTGAQTAPHSTVCAPGGSTAVALYRFLRVTVCAPDGSTAVVLYRLLRVTVSAPDGSTSVVLYRLLTRIVPAPVCSTAVGSTRLRLVHLELPAISDQSPGISGSTLTLAQCRL